MDESAVLEKKPKKLKSKKRKPNKQEQAKERSKKSKKSCDIKVVKKQKQSGIQPEPSSTALALSPTTEPKTENKTENKKEPQKGSKKDSKDSRDSRDAKGSKGSKASKGSRDSRDSKKAKKSKSATNARSATKDKGAKYLYPSIEPYDHGFLKVSETHTIYYEQSGNANGKPVVFLHGGPGAGCDDKQRCFFDPEVYRIVLFDQRGCGKSTPYACLEDNTTWHLVADIEQLRKHLGIEKWQVFGGSWGSTLALAYAQANPQAVSEMILRGIFLCTQEELHWFYQKGASEVFPEYFAEFLALVPHDERHDMMGAYQRMFYSDDESVRNAALKSWSVWEGRCSKHDPDPDFVKRYEEPDFAGAFSFIEMHYFVNRCWLEQDQLLRNVPKIQHIPCVIVHGRYDMVCPITNAWSLHKAWPQSKLLILPDAGHSAGEVATTRALVEATDAFAKYR
jgi:proline iminopeptidase